jgi:hypothetical protein
MTDMTPEVAAKLRAPFPGDVVGKLPRITCPKCRDARTKNCDEHPKARCNLADGSCGGWITPRHIHLAYVGHAAVTSRLLEADPAWTWEPVAFGEDGLPAVDRLGGLWIRLTVAGVTRFGYGHADGKTGPDAVKEAISDSLRNSAMRFGVALDLWHKDGELVPEVDINADRAPAPKAAPAPKVTGQRRPSAATEAAKGNPELARAGVIKACEDNGWDDIVVRKLFAAEHGMPMRDCTDAVVLAKFRSSLFNRPQAQLQPAAAAAVNGAAP